MHRRSGPRARAAVRHHSGHSEPGAAAATRPRTTWSRSLADAADRSRRTHSTRRTRRTRSTRTSIRSRTSSGTQSSAHRTVCSSTHSRTPARGHYFTEQRRTRVAWKGRKRTRIHTRTSTRTSTRSRTRVQRLHC